MITDGAPPSWPGRRRHHHTPEREKIMDKITGAEAREALDELLRQQYLDREAALAQQVTTALADVNTRVDEIEQVVEIQLGEPITLTDDDRPTARITRVRARTTRYPHGDAEGDSTPYVRVEGYTHDLRRDGQVKSGGAVWRGLPDVLAETILGKGALA